MKTSIDGWAASTIVGAADVKGATTKAAYQSINLVSTATTTSSTSSTTTTTGAVGPVSAASALAAASAIALAIAF